VRVVPDAPREQVEYRPRASGALVEVDALFHVRRRVLKTLVVAEDAARAPHGREVKVVVEGVALVVSNDGVIRRERDVARGDYVPQQSARIEGRGDRRRGELEHREGLDLRGDVGKNKPYHVTKILGRHERPGHHFLAV